MFRTARNYWAGAGNYTVSFVSLSTDLLVSMDSKKGKAKQKIIDRKTNQLSSINSLGAKIDFGSKNDFCKELSPYSSSLTAGLIFLYSFLSVFKVLHCVVQKYDQFLLDKFRNLKSLILLVKLF